MSTVDDGSGTLTALILQVTRLSERLTALEERTASSASHAAAVAAAQQRLLDGVAALDTQVTAIAMKAELVQAESASQDADDGARDIHGAAPQWWRLEGDDRERAIARLRAWVDQVYRPSYGHLAAALAPCWDQHPLCLFGLHWLMELWSELHLIGPKQAPDYASQAEWQTRLLPALAEQMRIETARCQHRRGGQMPMPAWPR
jgi:hypothetical protein